MQCHFHSSKMIYINNLGNSKVRPFSKIKQAIHLGSPSIGPSRAASYAPPTAMMPLRSILPLTALSTS